MWTETKTVKVMVVFIRYTCIIKPLTIIQDEWESLDANKYVNF